MKAIMLASFAVIFAAFALIRAAFAQSTTARIRLKAGIAKEEASASRPSKARTCGRIRKLINCIVSVVRLRLSEFLPVECGFS